MKVRPTVFMIMPITPRDPKKNPAMEYLENCRAGFEKYSELLSLGFAPYCPATDMHVWLSGNFKFDDAAIYESDCSLLQKMDAVLLVNGWSQSKNCAREYDLARDLGIPVFSSTKNITVWKETQFNANV